MASRRKALALDLGSLCGWATNCQGLVWSGVQDFTPSKRESNDMRYVRFHDWLEKRLEELQPEIVGYEMPHNRGGHATQVLNGLAAIVQLLCGKKGVTHTPVHSSILKKHATGSGRASKGEMLEAAKQRFPDQDIKDDNQADALHLLDYLGSGEWR